MPANRFERIRYASVSCRSVRLLFLRRAFSVLIDQHCRAFVFERHQVLVVLFFGKCFDFFFFSFRHNAFLRRRIIHRVCAEKEFFITERQRILKKLNCFICFGVRFVRGAERLREEKVFGMNKGKLSAHTDCRR